MPRARAGSPDTRARGRHRDGPREIAHARAPPALALIVVLAQRVTLELVVAQQAAQERVAAEEDAHQVVGLALEPVGRPPYRGRAVHDRILLGHAHLDPHAMPER